MQRNESERRRDPRKTAERDASQPMGGQPRPDDGDEPLEKPENVPSFLTARELQAREPAKSQGGEKPEMPAKQPGQKRGDD
jgi:hypothetical protein